MNTYQIKSDHVLYRAVLSPLASAIVDRSIDWDRVDRYLSNLTTDTARKVREELGEVRQASAYQSSEAMAQREPARVPDRSVEPASEWISTSEAAKILGKSTMTVRRYIEAGAVESKRKDKKSFLVLRESVEALNLGKHAA